MNLFLKSLAFLTLCTAPLFSVEVVIESKSGKSVTVTLLDYANGQVSVATANGKKVTVSMSDLSTASVNRIEEAWAEKAASLPEIDESSDVDNGINAMIGSDLFDGMKSLWGSDAKDVAKR